MCGQHWMCIIIINIILYKYYYVVYILYKYYISWDNYNFRGSGIRWITYSLFTSNSYVYVIRARNVQFVWVNPYLIII